jgi:Multimeric flavodoxin WrbA
MKVVAINTSPEGAGGLVSLLLDPFLDGLREAGAETQLYYARDLVIFPCCGNLNCTVQTPGKCMAYDDMRWLRQKIGQADVLVLASPLYFDGHTGPEGATSSLRTLLERLIPGTQMSAYRPYEHAVHTTREDVNLSKVIIASGSGFWEIDGLFPVLTHIKALCYNTFPEFAGNITESRGVLLLGPMPRGMTDWDIIAAAREAGYQLAYEKTVPPTAHDLFRREAVTRDFYGQITAGKAPGTMVSYAMPAVSTCKHKEE